MTWNLMVNKLSTSINSKQELVMQSKVLNVTKTLRKY